MTNRQMEEMLSQHADRLVIGSGAGPVASAIAAQNPPERDRVAELSSLDRAGLSENEQRSLGGLMQLARRVQKVLVEVEPRPAFVTDLKSRLVAQRRIETQAAGAGKRAEGRGILWLAGVAGAVSIAGLGFLSYRLARAGAGWLATAVSSRNARPALRKA